MNEMLTALRRGYDQGNFARAHGPGDFERAWPGLDYSTVNPDKPWDAGFLVGFFASREDSEIPAPWRELWATAQSTWSEEMAELRRRALLKIWSDR